MVEPEWGSLESLAPARRAVLVLLTSQNRTYSDIATLLATDEAAIRARAFEAVDELLSGLSPAPPRDVREQLVDYALGQQRVSERQRTRALLAADEGARSWLVELERALGVGDSSAQEPDPGPPQPPATFELSAPTGGAPSALPIRLAGTRVYLVVGSLAIVLGLVLLLIGGSGSAHP